MREYPYIVAGESTVTYVPETAEDLDAFRHWILDADARGPIALDTETTGLDIYSPGYRLRTVQFGDARTAWVIHWERGGEFRGAALYALRSVREFLIHNAPFDWCVLDAHAGVPLESLAPRTTDTRILAALVDPRQPQEGGIGTALKPLAAYWVDPSAPDTQAGLTAAFRAIGHTKATGWANIPLNDPTYNLYAGLDCILTARLAPKLRAELKRLDVREALVPYEHELARICATMQRTGMLLDMPYTKGLQAQLLADSDKHIAVAQRYGVASVNSARQVADALQGMGETLTDTTDSGALRVDKGVLLAMADLNKDWERLGLRNPNPLADAILRSKRALKWRSAYADTMLDTVDAFDRVHPMINSMQARTARMSVTRPALQTLPSGDWTIRRALLADEGHVIVSVDLKAVELRVLAALADVRRMKEAIAAGDDLHNATATLIYGPNFTPKNRTTAKVVGLSKVFGGGAATTARQTGLPVDEVASAMRKYDEIYPEVRRYSNRQQRFARQHGWVQVSATGRRLPLDKERPYAATNHSVQSAARDVLCQSILNAEAAGLLPYMRLFLHDEVLLSAPKGDAQEIANEMQKAMTWKLAGVQLEADADIYGRSWGSGYGAAY